MLAKTNTILAQLERR